MASPFGGRMSDDPPPGFEVWRGDEIDPEQGRADRWVYVGSIGGRRFIRTDHPSRATACRSAWMIFDAHWPHLADRPNMKQWYCVRLDEWRHMEGSLLAQLVHDAGSIRKAAKVVGIPRATFGAWVKLHKDRGTWPL